VACASYTIYFTKPLLHTRTVSEPSTGSPNDTYALASLDILYVKKTLLNGKKVELSPICTVDNLQGPLYKWKN